MLLPAGSEPAIRGRLPLGYWGPRDPALPMPQDFVDPAWPAALREAVATYLDHGSELVAWRGRSWCRVCERDNGHRCLGDDRYNWPEGLGHYVREHGVRPPERFVTHVLRRLRAPWLQQVEALVAELREHPLERSLWAVLGDLLTEQGDPRGRLVRIACPLEESPLAVKEERKLRDEAVQLCRDRPLGWFADLGLPPRLRRLAPLVRTPPASPWPSAIADLAAVILDWLALAEAQPADELYRIAEAGFQRPRWSVYELGPPVNGRELVGLVLLARGEIGEDPRVRDLATHRLEVLWDLVFYDHRSFAEDLPAKLAWWWLEVVHRHALTYAAYDAGTAAAALRSGLALGFPPDGARERLFDLLCGELWPVLRVGIVPVDDPRPLLDVAGELGVGAAFTLAWRLLERGSGVAVPDAELADALEAAEGADSDVHALVDRCERLVGRPLVP